MKSLFGLPKKVVFCKKCVLSNQRPNSTIEFKNLKKRKIVGTNFQKPDICGSCEFQAVKDKIDWTKREKELKKILKNYRRKSGYDVVVPSSGGKDSAYTAHILKYKYNMNPLTVTWSPHKYTDIGFQNFENFINVGGFDNILFSPNGKLHRYLTKISFLNLLHPFQPFIIGQKIIGPMIAKKFNIDLIVYGENPAEREGIDGNKVPKMSSEFFSSKNPKEIKLGGLSIREIMSKTNFKSNEFQPYVPLTKREASKLNFIFLGYFHYWDLQENYYYATKNTGFKPNSERTEGSYSKYSSLDDCIDYMHYYTTFIKFGLGRASYDAAQEIVNRKITREEGIALVKKYDGEFPNKYFDTFLEYTGLDKKTFFNTIDKFRSPHLWKNDKGVWKLRNQIS